MYSEIVPFNTHLDTIRKYQPKGIILSGGPDSVYETNAPAMDTRVYELGIPILGVCYGMQLIAKDLGGKVEPSQRREYGSREIDFKPSSCLLAGMRPSLRPGSRC